MNQEIADLGLEREELGRAFGQALIGGERIPYEPKQLSGIVTILRGYAPQRYLAIEGMSEGGWRYIGQAVGIPHVSLISPNEPVAEIKKTLRAKGEPYDLISIDARGLPLSAGEIWKYIEGGKETVTAFGKGAATDYGPRKIKPGTLVLFNLADLATKDLYFQLRTMDNKLHQSLFAGMIKI